MLLWVPGCCGIQCNEDADALAREGWSSPFFSPKPAISVLPCVGRLEVKEWLKERHSEYWTAAPGMWQSIFIVRPSDKLSMKLMALDRKQCRLVTRLLTGRCTFRWHIHIMGLSENAKCGKCGQEKKPPTIYSVMPSIGWA
jgi:hypothetical protein